MMQQPTYMEQEPIMQQGRTPDQWRLLVMVQYIQEVEKPYEPMPYRGISDAELMYRLKWTQTEYETIRDQLLTEPDPVLIKTPSGGIAHTW